MTPWERKWKHLRPAPLHKACKVAPDTHIGPLFLCPLDHPPYLVEQVGFADGKRIARHMNGKIRPVCRDVSAYIPPNGLTVPNYSGIEQVRQWVYLVCLRPEADLSRLKIGYELDQLSRVETHRTTNPWTTVLYAWPVKDKSAEARAIEALERHGVTAGLPRPLNSMRGKGAEVFDVKIESIGYAIAAITAAIDRVAT